MPNSQSPFRWSKDFVEHLRTAHFALIAISVGLILLVLSSRRYNPVTALVELDEVLSLKQRWSAEWIGQNGHPSNPILMRDFSEKDMNLAMPIDQTDTSLDGEIVTKDKAGNQVRIAVDCLLERDNWYQATYTYPNTWSPKTYPGTLGEFKTWWEGLATPYVLYFPVAVARNWKSSSGTASFRFERSGHRGANYFKVKTHLDVERLVGKEDPRKIQLSFGATIRGDQPDEIDLQIPVVFVVRSEVTQKTLEEVFHNLHPGPFEDSFADLAVLARDEVDLPLEQIKDFIHDEAAKGPEVFEAFGVKFPADQIRFWGDALILSIQLYLALCLRRLSGELRIDDAGWEVGWLAMDSSLMSRTLLFNTLVILPCCAVIMISEQALTRFSSEYTSVHVLGIKILSFVAVLASGYLGLLSWKYRPQIAPEPPEPPSCPAQLFE